MIKKFFMINLLSKPVAKFQMLTLSNIIIYMLTKKNKIFIV